MKQSDDNKFVPMTSLSSNTGKEVAPDLYYYTNQIVNLVFIGDPKAGEWVLVDTGMPKCGPEIETVAYSRFGQGSKPKAIILTHGHFDHVGNIVHLLEAWPEVPVYAHPLEFPYLTGQSDYPEPDPSVQGGLLAKISSIYPHEAIDISGNLSAQPEDGSVPFLPEWRWIHVPDHAPGQIALFREKDAAVLPADAFVTVRQDSLYKVLVQKEEVNGPPRYLTTDWDASFQSVVQLRNLHPRLAIAGHGQYMEGEELSKGLERQDFDDLARPDYGKYV